MNHEEKRSFITADETSWNPSGWIRMFLVATNFLSVPVERSFSSISLFTNESGTQSRSLRKEEKGVCAAYEHDIFLLFLRIGDLWQCCTLRKSQDSVRGWTLMRYCTERTLTSHFLSSFGVSRLPHRTGYHGTVGFVDDVFDTPKRDRPVCDRKIGPRDRPGAWR